MLQKRERQRRNKDKEQLPKRASEGSEVEEGAADVVESAVVDAEDSEGAAEDEVEAIWNLISRSLSLPVFSSLKTSNPDF